MAGIAWGRSDAFLDEHPEAYKPIDVVMHPLDVLMRPITGSTGFHPAAVADSVPDPTKVRTTTPQPLPGTIPRP